MREIRTHPIEILKLENIVIIIGKDLISHLNKKD